MNYTAIMEYQKIDGELRKIEMVLKNSDERKKTSQAKAFLIESEETARRLEHRAEELIAAYRKLCEQQERENAVLKEYESMVADSSEDLDELRYMEKKISKLADSLNKIDADTTALQRDIDEIAREFNEFRKRFTAAKEDYKKYKQQYEALKESKKEEMDAIAEKLAVIAKKIPAATLERYKQKRADKLFPVFVEIRSGMCSVCSMELSLNDKNRLKKDGYVECEHCKRVLFQVE